MIYLDNAATTFPKPETVYKTMDDTNRNAAINAGRGAYRLAREASKLIFDTKNMIRKLIHADSSAAVVFTPSITIALNEIINGIEWNKGDCVYVSPYDHNAVARTLHLAEQKQGIKVYLLPIDTDTYEIDIEKTKYEFSRNKPRAVFCTHVSNVTGYILPVIELFEEAKKYDAITVLDSAQSLGLVEIDSKQMKADIIAFAGHKSLYGPFGIGGFVNVGNIILGVSIVGGTGSDSLNLNMPEGNESKYESASMNIVAISGLYAALQSLNQKEIYEREKLLTRYLVNKLESVKGLKLFVPTNPDKHIGIVSFTINNMNSEDVGIILDEEFDIAVRTGYHCAPYIHEFLGDCTFNGTVRVSLGINNDYADIDRLAEALNEVLV